MAHTKSQEKRNRQTVARTARNKAIRSELKTRVKKAVAAADEGDPEKAAEAFRIAQKRIDQAVAKGVLKKNTAARRKSSLARQVGTTVSPTPPEVATPEEVKVEEPVVTRRVWRYGRRSKSQ